MKVELYIHLDDSVSYTEVDDVFFKALMQSRRPLTKVIVDVRAPVESQYADDFMSLLASFRIAILNAHEAMCLIGIKGASLVFDVKKTELEVMNLIRNKCEEMITKELKKEFGQPLQKEIKKRGGVGLEAKFDYSLIQVGPASRVGKFLDYDRVKNKVCHKEVIESVTLFRQKHQETKIVPVEKVKHEWTSLLRYRPITLKG